VESNGDWWPPMVMGGGGGGVKVSGRKF